MYRKYPFLHVALLLVVVGFLEPAAWSQQITNFDRDRAQSMLKNIASDVKKHYYDPKFHGVDWDAQVQAAKQRIDKADSMNRALSEVAAALDNLNDSHTFFLPPQHAYRHDFGWQAQMIGERCYVVRVRPNSDAEAKGVKPGDEVLAINGYAPSRTNFWKMEYVFKTLRPQPGLRLQLRSPAGSERQADVMAKITQLKRVSDLTGASGDQDVWDLIREIENEEHQGRARWTEKGDDLMILKFPAFDFTDSEMKGMIDKARKHKALILDLRGNGGGSADTLKYLAGAMFENEVKIGDRVGREDNKPMTTKGHGHDVFSGKLVVLVDSESASASEIFAHLMQLEKRGTIVGDHTAGSVMEAKHFSYRSGTDTVVFFGASITEADVVMGDGKSLEHTGVSPDVVVMPSAADLASGRDPVLARAAETLGVKLTAEEAGKMFPYEWPSQ